MTLDEIALKYGTDKASDVHFYTRYYEQYFEPLRNNELNLLEIGIQEGRSLKMWKEYFPNAQIIGLDIENCDHLVEDRLSVIRGDQKNVKHLKLLPNIFETIYGRPDSFDIIIDDGSHKSEDMLVSFETLFPLLKPGGIYVIEDIHVCYWDERPFFARKSRLLKRLKALMDDLNARGKSGLADRAKLEGDQVYKDHQKRWGKMTWWEENVEYVHLFRSIAFIKRV